VQPITAASAMEIGYTSIQLAAILTLSVYPIGYMIVSVAKNGGTLESNLPPGVPPDFLMVIILVGGFATLIYGLAGYARSL
jgi:hypothetical protein